jgi:hypothetical protein
MKSSSRFSFQLGLLLVGSFVLLAIGYWLYQRYGSLNHTKSEKVEAGDLFQHQKLRSVYPEIQSIRSNRVWFRDGSSIVYDDRTKHKTFLDSLNNVDV